MASKPTSADSAPGAVAVDAVAVPITAEALAAVVVYRDRAFISRTLVMHGGRLLHVSKHHVEAPDAEAQAFLDEHPDLERLPE